MPRRDWSRLIAGLTLAAPAALVARAETYLSETQAAAIFFPGIKMEPRPFELTANQAKAVAKTSGERVRDRKIRAWVGSAGETMIVDEVVGKHDFITYAVGIGPDGKVRGVEILDYRETYGYEIRKADWRRQFVGKSAGDPLRIDKDIRNISGATLSSVHVTNGVRRVLRIYEVFKARG